MDYDRNTSTKIAGLGTIKMHLNSTISTEGVKYTVANIGNFYINSKLDSPELMHICLSSIPQEIINEHDTIK